MKKKHVVYIVSSVEKSLAFEWIASRLHREFQITFLLMNPGASPLESFLRAEGIAMHRIVFRGKRDYITAFLRITFFLLRNRPAVVHAHLWDAQLIGLSSAWLTRIRNRIYTRHTSNYHRLYKPSGIKYDRLCNWLATRIVSISQATFQTLEEEGVPIKKVVQIPHGFDFSVFENIPEERVRRVRSKWKIPDTRPIIGVVSRHIEWKGVQFVVPAFAEFLKEIPEAVLVLANASGPYQAMIGQQLASIAGDRIVQIPFEDDAPALYRLFDMFVHVPVDPTVEAFGQTYVEALASGVPSIVTRSGIAVEFIEDRTNAIVVPFQDSQAIVTALTALWQDDDLRKRLSIAGKRDVTSRYGIHDMVSSLMKLYNG